jgi:hypothetical protein
MTKNYQERTDAVFQQLDQLRLEVNQIIGDARKEGAYIVGYRKLSTVKAFLSRMSGNVTQQRPASDAPAPDLFKRSHRTQSEPRKNPPAPDFFSKYRQTDATQQAETLDFFQVQATDTAAQTKRSRSRKKSTENQVVLATNAEQNEEED